MSAFLTASSELSSVLLASGGEAKKSGPLGLAVILVLCVACYFLFKSMSKHLRKVREEFPVDQLPAEPADPADDPPTGARATPATPATPATAPDAKAAPADTE